MFLPKIFKKKKKEEVAEVAEKDKGASGEAGVKLEIKDEDLEKEIIIHTMPKQFIAAGQNTARARKTGLIILSAGFVFLVAVSGLLYFFLFKYEPGGKKVPIVAPATPELISGKETATSSVVGEKEAEIVSGEATTTESLPAAAEQAAPAAATTTPAEANYSNGADTDGDGLTNKEETILKTNAENVDSDGDGYSDLTEIMNLYDPSIYADGRLINNPNIKEYTNSAFNYRVFYPAAWTVGSIGGSDSVMFNSGDNHFVQIIAQPNAGKETISDWYKREFNVGEIPASMLVSGQEWSGIKSDDGLIIYLTDADDDYIFVVTYNMGGSATIEYKNIFAMIIKSLVISQ